MFGSYLPSFSQPFQDPTVLFYKPQLCFLKNISRPISVTYLFLDVTTGVSSTYQEKLTLCLPVAINHQLLIWGVTSLPVPPYHAMIWSDLSMNQSCACCHSHCDLCAAVLLYPGDIASSSSLALLTLTLFRPLLPQ